MKRIDRRMTPGDEKIKLNYTAKRNDNLKNVFAKAVEAKVGAGERPLGDDQVIGTRCTRSNAFSRGVLIRRISCGEWRNCHKTRSEATMFCEHPALTLLMSMYCPCRWYVLHICDVSCYSPKSKVRAGCIPCFLIL